GLYGATKPETDKEKEWNALLDRYGFTAADEFDKALYEAITIGYFDESAILATAQVLNEKLKAGKQAAELNSAWEAYHGSFQDNESEILGQLSSAFENYVDHVTIGDLDAVVSILKDFDRPGDAKRLISLFMDRRPETRDFYDIEGRVLVSQIKDPEIKAAFKKRVGELTLIREPEEILLSIYMNRGWETAETHRLANLSDDDYYNMFKKLRGYDVGRVAKTALDFKNMSPPNAEFNAIAKHAENALKRIANESRLNRKRVLGYGISLD
ncbi:MAG: hypothetical protein WAM62_10435, partial [Pseudolabrys sp.]